MPSKLRCNDMLKRFRIFALLALLTTFFPKLCQANTLRILAPASLKESLTKCSHDYSVDHPDVHIQLSFGGSDIFATSILLGASVDLFISADRTQMLRVVKACKADAKEVHILLTNQLVIITCKNNDAGITNLQSLSEPRLRIAMAKDSVPAGAYALAMLNRANKIYGLNFQSKVMHNVVTEDLDVRQVLAHVALGQANAGFVYLTDAFVSSDKVSIINLPPALKTTATYSVAVLKTAMDVASAEMFMKFLLSAQAQKDFHERGFGPRPQK